MYPPVTYCTDSLCNRPTKGLKLQKTDQTQGVLYTLDNGVRPVWVIRFQCEGMSSRIQMIIINQYLSDDLMNIGCQTAYYHNYFVKNGMRHYYDGTLPEILQVGEHQFVEKKVVNMWSTDANISWFVRF